MDHGRIKDGSTPKDSASRFFSNRNLGRIAACLGVFRRCCGGDDRNRRRLLVSGQPLLALARSFAVHASSSVALAILAFRSVSQSVTRVSLSLSLSPSLRNKPKGKGREREREREREEAAVRISNFRKIPAVKEKLIISVDTVVRDLSGTFHRNSYSPSEIGPG